MIEIRGAHIDDDARLVAIDAAAWTEATSPAPLGTTPDSFFDHARLADVIVAEEDATVVGYVTLHNPIPVPSHDHVLQINGLAVAAEWTGRGIGRQLVAAAVTEAAARGARKVSLRVLGTNPTALHLYEASGFVVEGVLRAEFLLAGAYVDDVLMARFLD